MTGQVTQLLDQIASGDTSADPALLKEVYATLKGMAQARLAAERPGHTLSPTALVNEAYLRLVGGETSWNHRRHFFAAAANAMRRILIDHARRKAAQRRGANPIPVTFSEDLVGESVDPQSLIDLDQALDALDAQDEGLAEIVTLHFFAGFSFGEIASMIGVSERTVLRRWRAARAWIGARQE